MRSRRKPVARILDPVHTATIQELLKRFGVFSQYYALLLDHGRGFSEVLPAPYSGKPRQCFKNAYCLADADPAFTYVEGMAVPGCVPYPMEHAWVMDNKGRVIDPTWRDGLGYFGIPFEWEYVQKVAFRTKHFGILVSANRPLFDGRDQNWKKESM